MLQARGSGTLRIQGSTRLVGLLGWPVAHSLSPFMHNAAFVSLGIDFCYVPLPVSPDHGGLEHAVRGLVALGFVGANLTAPHKENVLPLCDILTDTARAIGAVNTLWMNAGGDLVGDNTDGPGFLAAMKEQGVELGGKHVLCVGAGGAARAVVYACIKAQAEDIVVVNRTRERAEQLVHGFQSFALHNRLRADEYSGEALNRLARSDVVVVTLPSGIIPGDIPSFVPACLRESQVFCELSYARNESVLMTQAQARGARYIDGLGMLLHQGALAFELWTGQPAPLAVMKKALLQAQDLRNRGNHAQSSSDVDSR